MAEKIVKLSLTGLLIIAFLGFLTIFLVYAIIYHPKTEKNYVIVGDVVFPFRSNIDDCMNISFDTNVLITLSNAERLILLMDPDGSAEYGITVYEVARATKYVRLQTTYAFTKQGKYNVSVLSLENATANVPIMLFQMGNWTGIRNVGSGQIILSGKNQKELDAAACRFDIELLDMVYGVTIP